MEYFPSHPGGALANLRGKTLVIPTVGHGNVGQLAVDLMIQTLVADRVGKNTSSRVGCLDHELVLPCVGVCAFARDEVGRSYAGGSSWGVGVTRLGMEQMDLETQVPRPICTALEIHGDEKVCPGFLWMQQRGDCVPGGSKTFSADLCKWIKEVGIAKVLVIGSLPSTQATTPEAIGNTRYRYVALVADGEKVNFADDTRWPAEIPRLEEPQSVAGSAPETSVRLTDNLLPPWSILGQLCLQKIDTACLLAVCSEGDNSLDAAGAANAAGDFLGIEVASVSKRSDGVTDSKKLNKWSVPHSWATAYGTRRCEMFS